MQLATNVISLKYIDNVTGKVRYSLTTNDPPIIGQNITLSCLIFDQPTWQMKWSKNSDRSLTSCTSTFCTVDRTSDNRYLFSTNESGIFMSLNFLNSQDAGKWKCIRSSKTYLIYKLEEKNMIYPPSSCVLTRKGTSFHCFSPCIKQDGNFTMMWRFQDKTSQAENIKSVSADCDQQETGIKHTTLKNYTGVITQNKNSHFKGEGQLTCTCGIEGYSTTVIESSSLEAYFYDCSISICIAVTFTISFVLIAITNGIIYFRRKTAGCLAFIKEWFCRIIIKGIIELLILGLVISICHVGCITETWIVTILLILLPVMYTICCVIVWCLCKKTPMNKGNESRQNGKFLFTDRDQSDEEDGMCDIVLFEHAGPNFVMPGTSDGVTSGISGGATGGQNDNPYAEVQKNGKGGLDNPVPVYARVQKKPKKEKNLIP